MNNVMEFIDSGILEIYVSGNAAPEQIEVVERMAKKHEKVRVHLYNLELALEQYALSQAKEAAPTIKPFLFATMDYIERINKGENISSPPRLNAGSSISDYEKWINREDLQMNGPLDQIKAHIIGSEANLLTAIVWIKNGTPPEVHKSEIESFLILEGACNIIVDGSNNHLRVDDVFAVPLNLPHHVVVTSENPCKILLQRVIL